VDAAREIEMRNSNVTHRRDPIGLVVQGLYNVSGPLVPMRPGQNFTNYKGAISKYGCLHALENARLRVLDIDFHHIDVHGMTALVVVESHCFNIEMRRALSRLPTLGD